MNAPGGKPEQQGDFRAAGLYMAISILLILFNKATFSVYDFAAPNVLTLSQNVCSLVFLLACRQLRVVEFHQFSMRNFRKMLPLGLTFIAYMVFGMIAMKVVNIPMYTTLRRTTVVFVMLLEYLISRKTSSVTIKFAVVLMIVGAMVAGVRDLNFDLAAYAIVVVYNVCTALYLVLINHISTGEKHKVNSPPGALHPTQKLEKYDFMYYNNLISIPLLLCIIGVTGETSAALSSPYWNDIGFLISLLASSCLAFALNYTIFWNTAVNSALTQTVSGQAKDVVVVLAGFVLFDDAHFDPVNVGGVLIGFAGSILYAATKIVPACTIEPMMARLGWVEPTKKSDDQGSGMGGGGSGMGGGGGLLPFTQSRSSTSETRRLIHHGGSSGSGAGPSSSPSSPSSSATSPSAAAGLNVSSLLSSSSAASAALHAKYSPSHDHRRLVVGGGGSSSASNHNGGVGGSGSGPNPSPSHELNEIHHTGGTSAQQQHQQLAHPSQAQSQQQHLVFPADGQQRHFGAHSTGLQQTAHAHTHAYGPGAFVNHTR